MNTSVGYGAGPYKTAAADPRVARIFKDAATAGGQQGSVSSVCPSLREFRNVNFRFFTMDSLNGMVGRVQVDPMKSTLKVPGAERLKLNI
jgi:hypothetical protein